MRTKKLATLAGSICIVMVLAVLPFMVDEAFPAPKKAPETIKIGAAPPLTGMLAAGGNEVRVGYEFAVEDINRKGGVYVKEFDKKIPLELILYDCESNPVKVVSRYEALYSSDHVVAYLGGFGSALHAAAAALGDKNKVPYVGVGFALWDIHQHGYKYLFSPFPKSPAQARSDFDFLDEMVPRGERPKTIAMWVLQSDWGKEQCAEWEKQAINRGYKVVSVEKYTFGTKDFSPLIIAAKRAEAEAVFANPITPQGIAMVKQMKELKYNPKFMFTRRAADTLAWSKALGPDGNYMALGNTWNYGIKLAGCEDLVKRFIKKHGHFPEAVTGPAYACVPILADAIERAGTLDRVKIRNALAKTDLMTVVGRVRFADDGTIIDPVQVVLQWLDEDQKLVWPKQWATAPFVYPVPRWDER